MPMTPLPPTAAALLAALAERQHGEHETRAYGRGQRSQVMSTARDEQAYLATLDERGIKYTVARGSQAKDEEV